MTINIMTPGTNTRPVIEDHAFSIVLNSCKNIVLLGLVTLFFNLSTSESLYHTIEIRATKHKYWGSYYVWQTQGQSPHWEF